MQIKVKILNKSSQSDFFLVPWGQIDVNFLKKSIIKIRIEKVMMLI